jgi:hypothetical protein
VNSPQIKYTADGKPRERLGCGSQITRGLTLALFLIALAIVAYPFVTTNLFSQVVRTDGAVRGIVVNAQNQPISDASLFLVAAPSTMVNTNTDGSFALDNVPSGDQVVIVVVDEIGQEFPVNIASGKITELGALSYIAPPDK